MRLLVNHSNEDRPHLPTLIGLMKAENLTGVASNKKYSIGELQKAAATQHCDAILLSNQQTLQECLGEEARLSAYRGTRINYTIPVIVVNPLEHTQTVAYGRWLLSKDLTKFRDVKRKPLPFSFAVCETPELLDAALFDLSECVLIAFDIETNEKLQITCISYAGLKPNGDCCVYILPFIDFGRDHFRDDDLYGYALQTMRDINHNPVPKIAFNGQYDATYTIAYHAEPHNFVVDPMILGWSEYSELPRSLDFNASLECFDYFYWKSEADAAKNAKDIRSYWAYCAKDSWYTLRIAISQMKNKPAYAITNYRKIFYLVYPALYTAFEGVKVDEVKRLELREEAVKVKERCLSDLRIMSADPEFNPGSWQQVNKFVYQTIGAKKPAGASNAGTDEKTLNKVSMQHPLLARICSTVGLYREQAKAISTYFDFAQKNGRLLYSIDPSGTETGRSASKASAFWVGTQIQNVPPYAKPMLVADEGYILLEADKNKSEARCVGYLSECLALIEALEGERDFYKVCASLFFGIPYEQVTKELRNDVTKRIIHGSNYVMGAETFIDAASPQRIYAAMALLQTKVLNILDFAKYLLSLYHKPFPEIRGNWYPAIKNEVQRTHKLVSPLGWTRYFFGDINKHHAVFRSAVAHSPQNLSVELINAAYYRVYKHLVLPSQGRIRLKAQIHDSIFLQCPEGQEQQVAQRMKPLMDVAVTVNGRQMLIPTEFKVGKRWGEMHDLKLAA